MTADDDLRRTAEGPWPETARQYAENADYWRGRAEKCEAATPPAEGLDVDALTIGLTITSWPMPRTEYERGWNEALAAVRKAALAPEQPE